MVERMFSALIGQSGLVGKSGIAGDRPAICAGMTFAEGFAFYSPRSVFTVIGLASTFLTPPCISRLRTRPSGVVLCQPP